MHMLRDVSQGRWIVDRAGEWATVAGIAGAGFEAYARLLHPVRVDRLAPAWEETTWPWGQVARSLGKRLHPWTDWMELTDNEALLDAPVADGWRIGQSDEGWFDPRLMARLTTHLRETTTTPEQLVLAFWEGFGRFSGNVVYLTPSGDDGGAGKRDALARLSPEFREVYDSGLRLHWPARDFLLAESSLTELADPDWGHAAGIGWERGRSPGPTPQMVWPTDHSWVVATEIDWDSTIVAGPRALIDAALADPAFEAFETDPARHPTEPR